MAKGGATALIVIGAGVGVGTLLAMAARKAPSSAAKAPAKAPKGSATPTASKALKPAASALVADAVKWSKTFGAPSSLLTALMAIESSFNPAAKNTNERAMKGGGAWGLTQLLLTTAKDITARNPNTAKTYWPNWDGTGPGLLKPENHLPIAAFMLAQHWKKFKSRANNWLTTGVSWHQGAGGVSKLITKGGGKLNPAHLPPNGAEYYRRLKLQQASNPVVNTLFAQEQQRGDFAYA